MDASNDPGATPRPAQGAEQPGGQQPSAGQPAPDAPASSQVPPASAPGAYPYPPVAGYQQPAGGYTPPAGYPPAGGYTPAGGYPPGGGYTPPGVPPAGAPRGGRGRAWVWWLAGIVVVLVIFGCMLSTIGSLVGGGKTLATSGDTIAVIPMDGAIAGTGVAPSVITPDDFYSLLKRANDDDSVKAIVLRVNSPGGTVAASEEIASYVKAEKKPVVVSVGDEDASGAYMVSSQAKAIIANPGSAVGSIGVIMEIPNASGLLDKVGVQFKVIHAGVYKDAGSPYRALTATETAMLQGQVDQVYGQFIDIVASGRHLPRSEVASLATGWAWNGSEAKQLGLVDQIGTYKDALQKAKQLGSIQGEYNVDVYSESSLQGFLNSLSGAASSLQQMSATTQLGQDSLSGSSPLAK
jgi:protease-4